MDGDEERGTVLRNHLDDLGKFLEEAVASKAVPAHDIGGLVGLLCSDEAR